LRASRNSGASHIGGRSAARAGCVVRDGDVGLATTAGEGFGTGMRSMRSRAQRLHATFSIDSKPGATVVRLRMPPA
jgi:nitrate/nitrite-specific signal transduction histidine kinase